MISSPIRRMAQAVAGILLFLAAPDVSGQDVVTDPILEPVPAPPTIMTPPVRAPLGVRLNRRKEYAVTPSADGKSLHVAGKIVPGITAALKDAIKKNPSVKTVVLTSNGGILIEGLGLSNVIRKNGLNTHAEFVCASACTFAFLAGKQRSIAATAAIGFHQSSRPLFLVTAAGETPQYVSGNELMRTVYTQAGLDMAFIETALKTTPSDMWFPETREVLAQKIATRLSAQKEFAVGAGPWKSSDEFVEIASGEPLFRAAKTMKPRYFRLALSEAWVTAAIGTGTGDIKNDTLESMRTTLVRQLMADVDQYDDSLLEQFIAIEQAAWDAKDSGFNSGCEASLGAGFPVDIASMGELRSRQDAVLLEMINKPVKQREPTQQRLNEAETVMLDFWGEMIAEHSYDAMNVASSYCREPGNYYNVLVTLPLPKRIGTFRSLALTAPRQGNLPRLPIF